MDWSSWALWLAQELISNQCLIAGQASERQLIRDKHQAAQLLPGQPPLGVYVDNAHVFSGGWREAGQRT